MKSFLNLIKEKEDTKLFSAECIIKLDIEVKNTDITNAGEEVMSELDSVEKELTDLGYKVKSTEMVEIEEEEINENVNSKEILNKTADEELEQDVVDIFNVVEARLNKISESHKEKALDLLKYKIEQLSK